MDVVIELVEVCKRYGDLLAIDRLSLEVERGELVGLLGRNGAGKSTVIKMLTGLVRPTSGRVEILGMALEKHLLEVKRRIGVMPEDMALLDRLTGEQYLRFVGRMYGLDDELIASRRAELFELLDLQPAPGALLVDYSYGMKKKVAFCAAILHEPEVVFLDEPFEGIDPVTSRTLKDILARLRSRGVTLVLTSHVLEIIEKLCSRVAILDQGQLRGVGTLAELRSNHGDGDLEQLFLSLTGGARPGMLSWL